METVRLGIIGVGAMGSTHIKNILAGKIKNIVISAFCDIDGAKLDAAKKLVEEGLSADSAAGTFVTGGSASEIALFSDYKQLIDSGAADAVLVSTPHYDHPGISSYALSKNVHTLCEKPAGVYTRQVEQMNETAKKSQAVFGIMYNQRTNPLFAAVKKLVDDGKVGELKHFSWIITNWYRTQSYYDSGSWRATWAGEGGGVLLNQCPHNLDIWQWITGMPCKIRAFCAEGKYHKIEVEDDVTIYAEYKNGATAVFISTTGEFPGTNRLEISGDRGKAVIENGKLMFYELAQAEREFCFTAKGGFDTPAMTEHEIKPEGTETAHAGILQNFTNAVLNGEKLLAPGLEGINGLTISNAAYLSSWTDKTVTLPLDADEFYRLLQEKIKKSTFKKPAATGAVLDMGGTFNSAARKK